MRVDMTQHVRCIVSDCENHTDEGGFIGDLCGPCHLFVTTNKPNNSQACRNAFLMIGTLGVKAIYGT